MVELKTPWDGHWREGEYLGFVRWSLGQQHMRDQYREATGDTTEIGADHSDAAALAYIQRFSDWLAANVFGTPDDVRDEIPYENARTLH